jgi:HlyD family secretion protein
MNNTNWRKWVGIGAVALAVIAAIVYGFLPQPVRVETQPVTRGPMQVVIEEEGETRVRERYVITAPVAGYAPRVTWAVGDAVQQGEALLMLEPMRSDVLDPRRRAEAEARVAAAEARLQSAREQARAATAQADYARAEHERMRGLFEAGSATQQQLGRAATEAQQAEANRTAADHAVEVAQYEVAAARTALRYSGAGTDGGNGSAERVRIPAPIDGRVLRVHHESEGVVSPGQPLLDLGDPKQLEVVVDVLSSDAVQIESGTPVRFERWGGPPLDGRVRTVEPTGRTKVSALGVEEQRVFVVADITGSSASGMDGSGQQESQPMGARSRLGDGYRVVARFITWAGEDVLQVPASALFRADGGWAVFVATDGEAEQRAVQVGHRSGLQAEVTAGLDEGERVITHPDDAIEDGTSIDPWE